MRRLVILIMAMAASAAVAAVRISNNPDGAIKKIRLRLDAEQVVVAEGGTGTNGFAGVKIFDFKEGRVLVHGVVCDLTATWATNVIANGAGVNIALGSATAIATTGATAHTSTRADLCANVEVDPFTNGVSRFQSELGAAAQFDGTATALDMYLNVLIDDADISGSATGTVNGPITILYSIIGDY